jgi:molybdopterin synthase catalytic subunit
MAKVRVQQEDFDIGAEFAALSAGRTDIGGLGCFVGTVRETAKGRKIVSMTLEHYPAMTERALARIAAEAESRWPLLGCTLIHRVGTLLPGDNIVLVLAASAHRQAALDAAGFLIDWLKTRAPFWKKERFADGDETWVEARAEDDAAAAKWWAGPPSRAAASTG